MKIFSVHLRGSPARARVWGEGAYDRGRVIHAAREVLPDKALCGKRPKPGSAGFEIMPDRPVDCFRCLERLANAEKKEKKS